MRPWHKYRSLPGKDKLRVFGFTFSLPLIAIALRIFGFKKVYQYLGTSTWNTNRAVLEMSDDLLMKARHIAYLVAAAGRYGFYRATCLHKALLLWWILKRKGIPAEFQIGVRKQDGKILSHAWVRVEGENLLEGESQENNFSTFNGLDY